VLSKEKGIVATQESNSLDVIQTISIKMDVSKGVVLNRYCQLVFTRRWLAIDILCQRKCQVNSMPTTAWENGQLWTSVWQQITIIQNCLYVLLHSWQLLALYLECEGQVGLLASYYLHWVGKWGKSLAWPNV